MFDTKGRTQFVMVSNLSLCSHYKVQLFAPARKPYQIGLPFTHKNGDFGAISVTERGYAAPISKVENHIVGQMSGADLGVGCRGCAPSPPPPLPPSPRDDLQFSNTTGILPKKKICGLLVLKQSKRRAPPPKKILDPPLNQEVSRRFTLQSCKKKKKKNSKEKYKKTVLQVQSCFC